MACGWLEIKRFHVLMFFIWQFGLIIGNNLLFPVFLNYKPDWKCSSSDVEGEKSEPVEWQKLNCSMIEECSGNISYNGNIYYSAAQEFDLLCGSTVYLATLISTATFVGVLIGAILFGQLSDVFGRKKIVLVVLAIACAGSCGAAAAPSWEVLLALRAIVGMSVGGCMNVLFAYTMEMINPNQRLFMRGFFNWGWGRMFFTLICFLFPNWRHTSVALGLVAVPPFLAILFLVPESIKYSQSKNRTEELKKSLQWIAKFNGDSVPVEMETKNRKEDIDGTGSSVDSDEKVYSIKDLFSSKRMTETTLTIWVIWFSASLGGYANDLNSGNLAGDLYLNQFLFALLIGLSKPLIFFFDTFIPAFSRRLLHHSSQSLVILCYIPIVILIILNQTMNDYRLDTGVTVISLIGTALIEYTWDACYVCAAECFPTVVRTVGIGSSSVWARVGGIIAPQMEYLARKWKPAPFATVAAVGIVSLIVSYKWLPETKGSDLSGGLPLEEKDESSTKDDEEMKEFLP